MPILDTGSSGSGSAPQQGRLTPLGDILEDAITHVCSFLYLEEVSRLDIAMCSASLRTAFLRSISGDALVDLKTTRNEFRRSRQVPRLSDREPILTPELSEWLSRRGLALRGYSVDKCLKEIFPGIFRNMKRLLLPFSTVSESETLTSILSESGHSLEEVSVKESSKFFYSPLPLLQTLHRLNPRVSAIEIDTSYPSKDDFSEVARCIASHFTHLTMLRLPSFKFRESSLADLDTILKASKNLQSFECGLTDDILGRGAHMNYNDGYLNLYNTFSSLERVHPAFPRFGGSIVAVNWSLEDGADVSDGELVHLMSMCSQLQIFNISGAKSLTDEGLIRALSPLPRLGSLYLYDCDKLTIKGVQNLIKACRFLEYLNVHDIGRHGNDTLNEDGNLALSNVNSDSLAHGGSLGEFIWDSSGISDSSAISDDDLYHMMTTCRYLQRFELNNATNVTDEGLIRALSSLRHLTSITLSRCPKLTVAGLTELAKRCRLVSHFAVGKMYSCFIPACTNQFKFEDGVITGKGDLYWPLAEVLSRRWQELMH
jgi:hypothetical protein